MFAPFCYKSCYTLCQVLQYKRKCSELEAEAESASVKSPGLSATQSRESPVRSPVEKPSVSNGCHGYTGQTFTNTCSVALHTSDNINHTYSTCKWRLCTQQKYFTSVLTLNVVGHKLLYCSVTEMFESDVYTSYFNMHLHAAFVLL